MFLDVKNISKLQNVPLEMSVISAWTRQLCWPAAKPPPPRSTSTIQGRLLWAFNLTQKQFNVHKPTDQIEQSKYMKIKVKVKIKIRQI